MITLEFILKTVTVQNLQEAVKRFDVSGIAYTFRQSILNYYPEYRGNALQLGIDISTVMEPFKTDWSSLQSINLQIVDIQNKLRLFGKWHPKYASLCVEHDALVMLNNELNKPITNFLKLYKKAHRVSVVKKKETRFQLPA